ncbi:MAG: hypothetical protein K0S47_2659 [Herbinix sp.]|jgi:hypothetical protein|nr:hypothetical protein [Herbinix sp.]
MLQPKTNFFTQIFYAITKPNKYFKLTRVSGGRLTGFVFLFSLFLTVIAMIPITLIFVGPNGIYNIIEEDVPDFELKNGELHVDERYEGMDGDVYVLVDTDIDYFTYDDIDKSYTETILISKTNAFVYRSYGRIQEIDFAQLGGLHLTKDSLAVFQPFLYLMVALIALFLYLFNVGAYFLTGLFYSLIGLIVSAAGNINLKFARIFKVAIYSKVTIRLLYLLIDLTKLELPAWGRNLFAILVTTLYVVFGVLSHKSDEAKQEDLLTMPNSVF